MMAAEMLGQISTHAPRAGSDPGIILTFFSATHFNPRSPCGERLKSLNNYAAAFDISTHAPRAGSDRHHSINSIEVVLISTHAPRAGSDQGRRQGFALSVAFQPTLPVRGATASTNKFEALILYHKYNFGIIP